MNKKITTYLLKLIRKGDTLFKQEIDDKYYITDGYIIFIIEKDKIEINPDLIKNFNMERILNKINSLEFENGILKHYIDSYYYKGLLAKIESENKYVYIQKEFLKYFDNYEFEISGNVTVAKIISNDEIIGYIQPVRMAGEKND